VKQRPFDDSHYTEAVDDVFFVSKFKSKVWPFAEAIQNLRETNHPTVFNVPDAPVFLRVNIDLTYPNRPNK
jgi:large subunit ribosomal protein L1